MDAESLVPGTEVIHPDYKNPDDTDRRGIVCKDVCGLCLPGEVFGPGLQDYLRLAFGNIREEAIPEAVKRFRQLGI